MELVLSTYLQQVKPVIGKLMNELLKKYGYVSILATDSRGKLYSVSRAGVAITPSGITDERGFVIKVYDEKGYSEYSFNEIREDLITLIIDKVEKQLIPMKKSLIDTIELSQYDEIMEQEEVFFKASEIEKDPREMGDEKIIEELTKIHEKGLAYDERIIDCRIAFEYLHVNKLFLSNKKELAQSMMSSVGIMNAIASKDEKTQYNYTTFSGQGGVERIDAMQGKIEEVAKVAIELLDAEPIIPGEYDVICDADVTGMIVHEAFGHGVEMDMFVKKRALAEAYIGEYVASPLVTMHDGAMAARDTGSYYFDDEGTKATDTVIIEKGILKRGISDRQTAMHLGTKPTGNGRRQSFERKAYTRMTNTYFESGESTLEEMIASIEDGFLLESAMSGMEDPKNWGIQCMVNIAREIKGGQLTGKIYSPIVLTGYVPDLLKSISMVSDDLQLSGSGFCGKGYKEWVKVSSGGPSIKARVRLG